MTGAKPSYLSELRAALHSDSQADALAECWAQREPTSEVHLTLNRLGIRFYMRSAKSRRLTMANYVFKGLWAAVPEGQAEKLKSDFLAAPAGKNFDWLQNARTLFEVATAAHQRGELEASIMDLLTHQLALFECELLHEPITKGQELNDLRINPTLDVRQFETDPTASRVPGDAAKALTEPLLIGYYQEPERLSPRWQKLDARIFAAVRIVKEGLHLEDAAGRAGVKLEELSGLLGDLCEVGLFVKAFGSSLKD